MIRRAFGAMVPLLLCMLAAGARFPVERFRFDPVGLPGDEGWISAPDRATAWVGLVRTNDGGRTWRLAKSVNPKFRFRFDKPSEYDETVFVSAKRGWLSAFDSTWQTEDGGETWTKLAGGQLDSFAFQGRTGWTGRASVIYTTVDTGRSWSKCKSSLGDWQPHGSGQMLGESSYAILRRQIDERSGEYKLGRSADGGCSWTVIGGPKGERLIDFFLLDERTGWASAYGGAYFKTVDAGATWKGYTCPTGAGVCGLFFFESALHGYLWTSGVVPAGFLPVFETFDGGEKWSYVAIQDVSKLPQEWTYSRFLQIKLDGLEAAQRSDRGSLARP